MNITLNGQPKTFTDSATVAQLLADLELEPIRVAVEINESLIPRTTFTDTLINDGDQIEIVTFVGGG